MTGGLDEARVSMGHSSPYLHGLNTMFSWAKLMIRITGAEETELDAIYQRTVLMVSLGHLSQEPVGSLV